MKNLDPFEYIQPDFYQFSEDSVALANEAYRLLDEKGKSGLSGLDLGAGCGVVGIELIKRAGEFFDKFTFLEKNQLFRDSLNRNLELQLNNGQNVSVITVFDSLENYNGTPFDLIVANPPFFKRGQGRRPSCPNKEDCRFLGPEGLGPYKKFFENFLAKEGMALFLFRPDIFSQEGFVEIFSSFKLRISSLNNKVRMAQLNF